MRTVVEASDGRAPQVGWAPALTFLMGAVILGTFAWNTWQSLHKRHERMTSEHGLRLLALAKASSLVAALFAGAYFGYALAFAGALETPLGKERFIHSGIAGLAGLLMLIAALLLERALQVPGGDDPTGKKKGESPEAGATPA